MTLLKAWTEIQPNIAEKIGKASYETWFSIIQTEEEDANTLLIATPDEFFKNWIIEHYASLLKELLKKHTSQDVLIKFSVSTNLIKKETQSKLEAIEKPFQKHVKIGTQLNDRFTFNNFVIGPSNRFASAASIAVAESPAKAYNPLFLYGQVGLGKTHLIQSITHKIKELHPTLKHCYISSEQFTNELIDSIRHRSTQEFRKKYRTIDVLLIDDIQFIAGKEATQEEFFHTFNNLHNEHKQIIITSDRPPREIANLEERLSSRFAWGLIADIQPPDFETRAAILRKKIESSPINVPDDVVMFIAGEIKTSIRELEGALVRVTAYSTLEGRPVTLEMTQNILKDMVRESVKTISIEMIQKTIAEFFKMSIADLRSKRRNKQVVLPRQIAMYIARTLTTMSLPDIGNAFGGRDHTTVMHSCKKIDNLLNTDEKIKNLIFQISTVLKQ